MTNTNINTESVPDLKENNIEKRRDFFANKTNTYTAVIGAIILGVAFALLVIRDFAGINLFLFSIIFIAATGLILYKDNNLKVKEFAYFATMFIIFGSVFLRLKQEIYVIICIMFMPALLTIATMYSSKKSSKPDILMYLFRTFAPLIYADKIFKGISAIFGNRKKGNKKTNQVFTGILISILLLLVIIPLMVSADSAFKELMENVTLFFEKLMIIFNLGSFIGKSILGALVAILFCGFAFIITERKMIGIKEREKTEIATDRSAMLITILTIISFVFLVFSVVQFNNLFIDAKTLIIDSNYARCAREGYFQLIVLSVINFGIILATIFILKNNTKGLKPLVKILLSYYSVLNIYLLISAAYKMRMYQMAYGLSIERLLVYILLVFECIAIIILFIKIFKPSVPFFKAMVYYTVGFWAIVSLINIDAWVMQSNANRFAETGKIDTSYIRYNLSDDASGKIKDFYFTYYDELSDNDLKKIYKYYSAGYKDMDEKEYLESKELDTWLEYNISSKKRAEDGLDILKDYIARKK